MPHRVNPKKFHDGPERNRQMRRKAKQSLDLPTVSEQSTRKHNAYANAARDLGDTNVHQRRTRR